MRILLLITILFFGCSAPKDNNSFENKTFELINHYEIEGFQNIDFKYSLYIFLEENRLLVEWKTDSIVALQQGNWDYMKKGSKEYLILEEMEQLIDTFELNTNDDFKYYEFLTTHGDTLKFKRIEEKKTFNYELMYDKKWIGIYDSILVEVDSSNLGFKYLFSKYQINSNGTYEIEFKQKRKGKWKYDYSKNRILLDSLKYNNDIIKIEKITKDTLIIWRRENRAEPKKIILIDATMYNSGTLSKPK